MERKMEKLSLTLLLLFSVFCGFAKTNENVPLLIWGDFTSLYEPAFKSYSADQFAQIIENYTNKNIPTVVFIENYLSPEDLSGCKNIETQTTCFNGLNKIKSKTYLPSVENPLDTLKELAKSNFDVLQLTADNNIDADQIVLNPEQILFIKLNDINMDEDKSDVLARHDKFITSTFRKLSLKYDNLIAVYTAKYPSYTISSHVRNVRETVDVTPEINLKQDTNPTEYYFAAEERVLIYYKKVAYRSGAAPAVFTEYAMDTAVLNRNATSKRMELVLSSTTHTNTWSLAFDEKDAGSWLVSEMKFNEVNFFIRETISANRHFSYTCAPAVDYMAMNNIDQQLQVTGLQVEARFIEPPGNFTAFSEAWDCVGFTSPAIWGGLFVVFILLLIMTVGISWMLDIRTMDRFDDPKGKTIIISATE